MWHGHFWCFDVFRIPCPVNWDLCASTKLHVSFISDVLETMADRSPCWARPTTDLDLLMYPTSPQKLPQKPMQPDSDLYGRQCRGDLPEVRQRPWPCVGQSAAFPLRSSARCYGYFQLVCSKNWFYWGDLGPSEASEDWVNSASPHLGGAARAAETGILGSMPPRWGKGNPTELEYEAASNAERSPPIPSEIWPHRQRGRKYMSRSTK